MTDDELEREISKLVGEVVVEIINAGRLILGAPRINDDNTVAVRVRWQGLTDRFWELTK